MGMGITVNGPRSLKTYHDTGDEYLERYKYFECYFKRLGGRRTPTQNKAMHKFFRDLSRELNRHDLDVKKVLAHSSPRIAIPWDEEGRIAKELWRAVQINMGIDKSTTELTPKQVSDVYDVLNRYLSETYGVFVPFPDKNEMKSGIYEAE